MPLPILLVEYSAETGFGREYNGCSALAKACSADRHVVSSKIKGDGFRLVSGEHGTIAVRKGTSEAIALEMWNSQFPSQHRYILRDPTAGGRIVKKVFTPGAARDLSRDELSRATTRGTCLPNCLSKTSGSNIRAFVLKEGPWAGKILCVLEDGIGPDSAYTHRLNNTTRRGQLAAAAKQDANNTNASALRKVGLVVESSALLRVIRPPQPLTGEEQEALLRQKSSLSSGGPNYDGLADQLDLGGDGGQDGGLIHGMISAAPYEVQPVAGPLVESSALLRVIRPPQPLTGEEQEALLRQKSSLSSGDPNYDGLADQLDLGGDGGGSSDASLLTASSSYSVCPIQGSGSSSLFGGDVLGDLLRSKGGSGGGSVRKRKSKAKNGGSKKNTKKGGSKKHATLRKADESKAKKGGGGGGGVGSSTVESILAEAAALAASQLANRTK